MSTMDVNVTISLWCDVFVDGPCVSWVANVCRTGMCVKHPVPATNMLFRSIVRHLA